MGKICPCGKPTYGNYSLCKECFSIYGYNSKEWPEWLRWMVNDNQRIVDSATNHKAICIDQVEPNGYGGYKEKKEFTLRGCRTETHLYEDRHNH